MIDLRTDIDEKILSVEPILLSSGYGDGGVLGQPEGLRTIGLVRVSSSSGVYGLGESYSAIYVPEIFEAVCNFLGAKLVGQPLSHLSLLMEGLDLPFVGRSGLFKSVSGAIEMALFDLIGKILEVPCAHLISTEDMVFQKKVYASSGSAALSPSEIVADARECIELGFSAYKMRIGYQEWSVDLERVRAARRETLEAELMVDAIMGTIRPAWSLTTALTRQKDLEEFGLRWLEEPLHPDDVRGLAALRNDSQVPIAAGEAYSSLSEYQNLIDLQAVDVLQIDVSHSGGFSNCLAIAQELKRTKLCSIAMHTWGSPVAIAANLSFAVCNQVVEYMEMPMVTLKVGEEMWIDPPRIENGVVVVDDQPGLGVILESETISRYPYVPNTGYRLPSRSQVVSRS